MAIYEIKKEPVSLLISKFVLLLCFIGSLMTVSSVALFVYTKDIHYPKGVQNVALPPTINSIEISSDGKSILNAESKETVFTINDANEYLRDSGYFYNPDTFQTTNAKYEGNCFLGAALSNAKDRIVFSSGCLPGDLPQAWIGFYSFTQPACNSATKICLDIMAKERINFLTGGSGKNFVWSQDDETITYEADLGLSGMIETRTIDSETGEILKKGDAIVTDSEIEDFKIYMNEDYGFKLQFPKEIFLDVVQGYVGPGVPGGEYNDAAIALHFRTSENDNLFSVLVFTKDQWERFGKKDYAFTYLAENNGLIYASEKIESDLAGQILSTFKFTEKK